MMEMERTVQLWDMPGGRTNLIIIKILLKKLSECGRLIIEMEKT